MYNIFQLDSTVSAYKQTCDLYILFQGALSVSIRKMLMYLQNAPRSQI